MSRYRDVSVIRRYVRAKLRSARVWGLLRHPVQSRMHAENAIRVFLKVERPTKVSGGLLCTHATSWRPVRRIPHIAECSVHEANRATLTMALAPLRPDSQYKSLNSHNVTPLRLTTEPAG